MADIKQIPNNNQIIPSGILNSNFENLSEQISNSTTLETRHYIGTTGEPAFQNNWINYDTSHTQCVFYKDNFGIVHLEGFIKSGTAGTVVFTLPTGYRPSLLFDIPILCSGTTIGYCGITTAGLVYAFGANASTWASLDGINFRVS